MDRRRLDTELVRRGLVASRAEARIAIQDGRVRVAGRPAAKPASLVGRDEPVRLDGPARRFVSRGGEKLDAALDRFGIEPAGRCCLDAGASTGGFTDRLLRGGAACVAAVDVGYGQLAWSIREDPRVTVLERKNVRDLTPADLPCVPSLVVADLSFISLRSVLPALGAVAETGADLVLLVKPQFEAGRGEVGRGGIVRDADVWRRSIGNVAEASAAVGLAPVGVMASPLRGAAGNVEFLLHAVKGGVPQPLDVDGAIAEGLRIGGAS